MTKLFFIFLQAWPHLFLFFPQDLSLPLKRDISLSGRGGRRYNGPKHITIITPQQHIIYIFSGITYSKKEISLVFRNQNSLKELAQNNINFLKLYAQHMHASRTWLASPSTPPKKRNIDRQNSLLVPPILQLF